MGILIYLLLESSLRSVRMLTTLRPAGVQMPKKPSIFVASSSDGRKYAEAIQWHLSADAEVGDVMLWSQGTFEVGHGTLEDLFRAAERHDFGVFVFTPDDKLTIGDKEYQTARDNVLFELGLFMGILGKERTIFVKPQFEPKRDDFRVPTDLHGIGWEHYNHHNPEAKDLRPAVVRAYLTVKQRAAELGCRHPDPSTAPSNVSPCVTAPKLQEILDAEGAIKMGATPLSPFVKDVMLAIVQQADDIPKGGTVKARDIAHNTGGFKDLANVLCCCEHLEQWGVLVHRERGSVWSEETPVSFVVGDEKDPHGWAYWYEVLVGTARSTKG